MCKICNLKRRIINVGKILHTILHTITYYTITHYVYRVSQKEWTKLRESVPYV